MIMSAADGRGRGGGGWGAVVTEGPLHPPAVLPSMNAERGVGVDWAWVGDGERLAPPADAAATARRPHEWGVARPALHGGLAEQRGRAAARGVANDGS